ncbi:putative OSM3-like kinesin [Trypanosoma theileri]|uniref:Putative OSM3-like kinesin n=1 Tax=Trypanosoma theileri TaxID=67003 RepID=A0A1X0P3T7_9TRYP|nr:putative OSM3-like kinesin [Trypanosoma theileri]ORC91587.1 putative OSM3-like kinesin [Trypanosoma theileri]
MSTDPANRLEELQAQLRTRKEALRTRVDALLKEAGDSELPPLEALREERMRLIREVQHHKDDGDAMALQIESNEDAAAVYRVAARVQRFEYFADSVETYVEKELPEEIAQVAAHDKNHSEDEVAAYITELQEKREAELKKINNLQERTAKRAQDLRNGPKLEQGEVNAHSRSMKAKEEELDKETKDTIEYTSEVRNEKQELLAKVKTLRQEKSKLQAELLDEKHKGEKAINDLKSRIRHAEMTNTRDTRRCQELNSSNAALTTNAQILMGQLNVEHYGVDGAPSEKKLLQERKSEERRAAKQLAQQPEEENHHHQETEDGHSSHNNHTPYHRNETGNSVAAGSGISSRRQSAAAKPPLVALKHTESQLNREAALRAEVGHRREEEVSAARARRRSSTQLSQASEH